MVPLESALAGWVRDLIHSKNELDQLQFTFGGNWDYDHGSFDRCLDEQRTVWLRIPFDMVQGEMDAEVQDTEARIRFGRPYVLKHLYKEGLDGEAVMRTYGALVDQFQEPTDKDAGVEPRWVEQARGVLREAERMLQ